MTKKFTILDRLLDWYTGGQITAAVTANGRAEHWKNTAMHLQSQLSNTSKLWEDEIKEVHEVRRMQLKRLTKYTRTLEAIIARGNTRSPNSTVKAMVKIAEKGLGK